MDHKEEEKEIKEESIQSFESFDDMGLKELLLRGIYSYGYEKPSPVQKKAICQIMKERDVIVQAQSGTGKTATFAISSIQKLNTEKNETQVLILSPTRELSMQTETVIKNLGLYLNVGTHICVGGTKITDDIKILKTRPHIVVGTPGRIYDMINRKYININTINMLILDEADEMLSYDFKDQLYEIIKLLRSDVQIVLISATMPNSVLELSNKFMRDPLRILLKNEDLTLEGIKQYYIALDTEDNKFLALCDLYDTISVSQCIIYCNRKQKVDALMNMLTKENFVVSAIHGDMKSYERSCIMNQFRSGESRILITTDLLSRGIDIQQVSMVINFDIPSDIASYIHRIGRSGRYGRKGIAINFITKYDIPVIKEIESFYHTSITELPTDFMTYIA